ncbi:SbcC-like subunit of palindrome specific endonuclease [Pseudomonas phage Deifobo]|nr:SbcC-like subunit of palindrome specific endonuclease [Pseudomonas phage Deifobo]
MLKFKSISMRNFMSVGNNTQTILLDENDLTLVLGENLDLGGNDSKNGTGKTAKLNALSYALFGTALTNIRKENLINKTNEKNMYVKLEFSLNNKEYKIERGRKPNIFKVIINNKELETDETDEAQGDSRQTQLALEKELGFSHNMFKNIIALNTYSTPFLSMKTTEQRELIEQLLGITKLSEKADILKNLVKDTKDRIKEEEFRIKAIQEANKSIEQNIASMELRSKAWDKRHLDTLQEYRESLEHLNKIDIDTEIEMHKILKEISIKEREKNDILKEYNIVEREIQSLSTTVSHLSSQLLKTTEHNECPTCGQELNDSHTSLTESLKLKLESATNSLKEKENEKELILNTLNSIFIPEKPSTFYSSLDDVYNHKTMINTLEHSIEKEEMLTNPHVENVSILRDSIKQVDFETINTLVSLRDHQEFLLKLLTSKDSFIRKKIIDQNLSYLNTRLAHYLIKIGLPHEVKFMSDLEVQITEHGRELDFDNLSRGERTRLILSLSWAFRDVFESLNYKINLLYIDELIDNGLDTRGVESALSILKQMSRDSSRKVFLVSHREELIGRVDVQLKAVKEGGFTSYTIEG